MHMEGGVVTRAVVVEQGPTDVETGPRLPTPCLKTAVTPAPKTADASPALETFGAVACEGGKCGTDEPQLRKSRCPPGCARKVRCCSACFVIMVATCGTLIGLFYPRDPDWNVIDMGMNATMLTAFANVVGGKGKPNELLEFNPKVSFWNPNRVGTMTESGKIVIRFGEHVIGHATVDASVIDAHSSGILQVHNKMRLSADAARLIFEHLSANNFELPVECDGKLKVARVGKLNVVAQIHCDILSNTLEVLGDPEKIIMEKKCTYSYSFNFGDN